MLVLYDSIDQFYSCAVYGWCQMTVAVREYTRIPESGLSVHRSVVCTVVCTYVQLHICFSEYVTVVYYVVCQVLKRVYAFRWYTLIPDYGRPVSGSAFVTVHICSSVRKYMTIVYVSFGFMPPHVASFINFVNVR